MKENIQPLTQEQLDLAYKKFIADMNNCTPAISPDTNEKISWWYYYPEECPFCGTKWGQS